MADSERGNFGARFGAARSTGLVKKQSVLAATRSAVLGGGGGGRVAPTAGDGAARERGSGATNPLLAEPRRGAASNGASALARAALAPAAAPKRVHPVVQPTTMRASLSVWSTARAAWTCCPRELA